LSPDAVGVTFEVDERYKRLRRSVVPRSGDPYEQSVGFKDADAIAHAVERLAEHGRGFDGFAVAEEAFGVSVTGTPRGTTMAYVFLAFCIERGLISKENKRAAMYLEDGLTALDMMVEVTGFNHRLEGGAS